MQIEKCEGVSDERRSECAKTWKTETRHANEQATKKLIWRRNKLILHKQNNSKEKNAKVLQWTEEVLPLLKKMFFTFGWVAIPQSHLDVGIDIPLREWMNYIASGCIATPLVS